MNALPNDPNTEPEPLWTRLLATDRPDWFTRLLMSLVAAAVLGGAAMLGLAVFDSVMPPRTVSYTDPSGRLVSYAMRRVDEEHVALALAIAGTVWCLTLPWIWRGYRRFRAGLTAVFQVTAIWVCAIPLCIFVDRAAANEEIWIAAIILFAGGGTFLVVARGYARYRAGRPVLTSEGVVNVTCPRCGYSLVGLSESRCPECGAKFTLDELIREQRFAGARPQAPPPPVAEDEPDGDFLRAAR